MADASKPDAVFHPAGWYPKGFKPPADLVGPAVVRWIADTLGIAWNEVHTRDVGSKDNTLWYMAAAKEHSTILHTGTHPRKGEPRFRRVSQDNGCEYGYLIPENSQESDRA